MSAAPSNSEPRPRRKHKTSKPANNEAMESSSEASLEKNVGTTKTAATRTKSPKTSRPKPSAPETVEQIRQNQHRTIESPQNSRVTQERPESPQNNDRTDQIASESKSTARKAAKSASSPAKISELEFHTPESSETKSDSRRTLDSTANTSDSKTDSSNQSASKTDNAATTDSKSPSSASIWSESKSNASGTTGSKTDASGAPESRSETPPRSASENITSKSSLQKQAEVTTPKRKKSDPIAKTIEFFRTRVPVFLAEAAQSTAQSTAQPATITPRPVPTEPTPLPSPRTPPITPIFTEVKAGPFPDRTSWSRASYSAPAAQRLPSIPDSSSVSELETPMKSARKAAAAATLPAMRASPKRDIAPEIRPKAPTKWDPVVDAYPTTWLANPKALISDPSSPAQPVVEPVSPGSVSPQIASLMAMNVRRRPSLSGQGKRKTSVGKGPEAEGFNRSRSGSRDSKDEAGTGRHVRQRISFQDRVDPDEPFPAGNFMSWDVETPVALYMASTGPLAQPPITVMTTLYRAAAKYPKKPAYGVKVDDKWQTINFHQLLETVTQAAKGLIKLGLDRHSVVVILGYNSTEWVVSHLATIFAGGVSASMHMTSSEADCQIFAERTKCRIIFVGSANELRRVLLYRSHLDNLLAIIQCNKKDFVKSEDVYSWEELLELGQDVSPEALHERALQQAPNVCCSLVQTIGSAAAPKTVLLSHDNVCKPQQETSRHKLIQCWKEIKAKVRPAVTWVSNSIGRSLSVNNADGVTVSCMPLSSIVAQVMDIYVPIRFGVTVYFAPESTVQGSVFDIVQEVRPTIFWTAGRLYDVLMDSIKRSWCKNVLKKLLMKVAINIGLRGYITRGQSQSPPIGWNAANSVVCNRIRKEFGLDRCAELLLSGGSVRSDVWSFYCGLNMDLLMSYGMAETTGQHTMSLPDRYRQRSVGLEMDGCTTLIDRQDKEGIGELLLKGRNIAMGYLDMMEETADMFNGDGWFRTGDLGKRDEDGFLYVVGRIDQQIHLSTGEVILPAEIEFSVSRYLPCVHYCMVVGKNRPFLGVLMTLKTQLDPETGRPTSDLSEEAVRWFGKAGTRVSTVNDVFPKASKRIVSRVQRAINRVNDKAPKTSHRIIRWSFLPGYFSLETGEIGQSLAIRRWVVEEKYGSTIESLFA